MRAVATWQDKVHDRDRVEQCIYDLCFRQNLFVEEALQIESRRCIADQLMKERSLWNKYSLDLVYGLAQCCESEVQGFLDSWIWDL